MRGDATGVRVHQATVNIPENFDLFEETLRWIEIH